MPEVKVLNEKLLVGLPPGTWVAISEDQERHNRRGIAGSKG
jgi:hypothetical protein